tara:strand:- start:1123 stop:1788 length:666 start_codon:yes stop_codon:yes gene_type:complete
MGPYTVPPIGARLGLVLIETNNVIEQRMRRALRTQLTKKFRNSVPVIENLLKRAVVRWILQSPEIQSLLGGQLQGDFGIPNPSSAVSQITHAVVNSVDVRLGSLSLRPGSYQLIIGVQPESMRNVLTSVAPVRTEKGETLPWIDWLITEGDAIIITGYHVNEEPGKGRSGLATMRRGGNYTVGRVDPTFSGTIDDNFITRALDGKMIEVASLIVRGLERTP